MRLSKRQQQTIKTLTSELFGDDARVTLFGSRVDDDRKGGDIDIMVTTNTPIERPALLAAKLSARISRQLDGQQVDVILNAPSLKRLPIHAIAEETGVRL